MSGVSVNVKSHTTKKTVWVFDETAVTSALIEFLEARNPGKLFKKDDVDFDCDYFRSVRVTYVEETEE